MSLALSMNDKPIHDDRSQRNHHQQQQDDDDVGVCRDLTAGVSQMPLSRTPFPLPIRDGAMPSPDRDRAQRALGSPSFDQLKSPLSAVHASHTSTAEASASAQLQVQVEKLKEALQVMRVEKDHEIAFLREQLARQQGSVSRDSTPISDVPGAASQPRLVPWIHSITERGDIQTSRLGRHASLKSTRALAELQAQQQQLSQPGTAATVGGSGAGIALAERMAAAFLNPVLSLPYLHSIQFGADLVELSAHVGALLERESRCLALTSPVYVFGDLHGNLADLTFFQQHLWRFGFGLAAGSFLFLGDYVDRGASSLECVAYLFAQKLLHPHKVFLLRGNHETRAVNGLEHYYGTGCFLSQCRARFGRDEGYIVWHQINHAFDRLPLAATIDDAVFCVHGGIPRALPGTSAVPSELRVAAIRRLPSTAPMDVLDKKFYDANPALRMVSDLLWGDPAREEHEATLDPTTGFGPSVQRGGSAVSFGAKAVDDFLESHGFSHVLRAHEAALDGVAVAKSARVLTIFSTSKDHALGDDATCGCVLVDRSRIAAINRSTIDAQRTVRRRRSVTSLQPPPPPTPTSSMALSSPSRRSVATAAEPGERGRVDHDHHAETGSNTGSATTASTSTMATRRRDSHRDAYPSTSTAASLVLTDAVPSFAVPAASAATAHRTNGRRRSGGGGHSDESDSTDDEAPSTTTTTPTSTPSRRARTARSINTAAAAGSGNNNNQSED